MATVTGFTKERMLAVENSTVVSGTLNDVGHLILTTRGGDSIDAGDILPPAETFMPMLRDYLYPVGKIYISVDSTDPGTLFGGTWELWGQGRVPVGVDAAQTEFETVEQTGGEKTHLLTSAESGLPAHNHTQNEHNHTQNEHNHTQNSHNHTQNAHTHPQVVTNPVSSGGHSGRADYNSDSSNLGDYAQGASTSATTATNNATTATNKATTATNNATTATNNPNDAEDASTAHNNLQPYITAFMWKRTA